MSMVPNKHGKPSLKSTAVIVGTMVSLAATLAGCAILAKLLDGGFLGEESIGYGVAAIVIFSTWLGAMTAIRKQRGERMLTALAVGLVYFLILLLMNLVIYNGEYAGVPVTALLIFGGSFLSIVSSPMEKKAGKTSKIKIPNR